MAGRNLLDFLGVWPTVEHIVDYFRGWQHTSRLREAETRRIEALAAKEEAEARKAVAEAARTEAVTAKYAIDLAVACGFQPEKLKDEAVVLALLTIARMTSSKRILAMQLKDDVETTPRQGWRSSVDDEDEDED